MSLIPVKDVMNWSLFIYKYEKFKPKAKSREGMCENVKEKHEVSKESVQSEAGDSSFPRRRQHQQEVYSRVQSSSSISLSPSVLKR